MERWRYGEGRRPGLGGVRLAEPVPALLLAWQWPQMWRIEDLELVPVDSKWLGHFYGGDCYLLLYTYLIGEKKHYLLYIWQVRSYPSLSGPGPARLPLQAAVTFELDTSGDGELTPFPSWECFGYEIPWAQGTPIHNPCPFSEFLESPF